MTEFFEVAIIGAGPAGLGAATNAANHKLSHVIFEKSHVGNTVYNYQLRKHVMAEPGKLPLRAHVEFEAGTRESILEAWNKAIKVKNVNLRQVDINGIRRSEEGTFELTSNGTIICKARNVVLSIGIQGSPRKLGVPGEDLPHVAYTLADPDAFKDMHILVVGAGDAAIENALALCEQNKVYILNRGGEFARAKEANNALMLKAISAGKIECFYNSETARIESEHAYITTAEGEVKIKCNHVIARLGCILPRAMLESIGIKFPNKNPDCVPVVNQRYESNVPGLFLLGALIGYPLIKQCINQGHEVIEHILGNAIEPADQPLLAEKLAILPGETNESLAMIRNALPLFKDLSDAQFRELIIDSNVLVRQPGETVFKRNDYTDTFFSVVKGCVEIELPSSDKVRTSAGNYFGEIGLISGRRRGGTVKTVADCILLESPRKQIIKLISSVESVKNQIDQAFVLRAFQSAIFPEADPALLQEVSSRAKSKNFKKNEILFKEGEVGDALYVIRKGSVKISKLDSKGKNLTQSYLAAGNFVGEMALLNPEPTPRSATVTAAVATETIVINKNDFLSLLDHSSELKKRIQTLADERKFENATARKTEKTAAMLEFILQEGLSDADNVLIIDSDLCVGCDNCEKACEATHGGYSRLDRKGGKSFASIQVPISCRHCENPLCMLDCPPDALARLPNGEVVIRDSCIGCGNCTRNCPYGVIQMIHDNPPEKFSLFSWLYSKKHSEEGPAKAAKCDQCANLDGGPACVRACPTGAAMRVHPSKLIQILEAKSQ